MKIRCPNCQEIFEASSQQQSLIDKAIKNSQRLLFVECPECYKDVPLNPKDLLSTEPQTDEGRKCKSTKLIECPICHEGIVSYVADKDEKFWGCGECGNVWFSEPEL